MPRRGDSLKAGLNPGYKQKSRNEIITTMKKTKLEETIFPFFESQFLISYISYQLIIESNTSV